MNRYSTIIALVLALAAIGVIWFLFTWERLPWVSPHVPPEGSVLEIDLSGESITAADIADVAEPPPGYVEYKNKKYGFAFFHNKEGVVTEVDEGGGAATIVLENFDKVRGMQVFIVPYHEDTISEERFKADVPSGVRENVEATTVGAKKIPAVTFTSVDSTLGETREVWFIQGGYLYEITTFKGAAEWFTPIIQSWRFL